MSVCLCVPKDPTNRSRDMVFISYSIASLKKVLRRLITNFGEGTTPLPRVIDSKNNEPESFVKLFRLKTNIESVEGSSHTL